MGRLKRLAASTYFRIWLQTVLPTSVIFLGMLLLVAPQALSSRLMLAGLVAALVLSTLVTGVFVRMWLNPFREVIRLTREMARGNYGVRTRAELARGDYRELATNINALAESLERTERLRRELVSNLAHEIRTPLTNLQGYLEALRDGVIEANQEALASVHEEVMRLVRLVDALHQLARADALRQAPLDLAPTNLDLVTEQLARVARPNAEARRVKLYADLDAGQTLVPVHADSVAQVMRNILRNAVQYTDEGGTIRVQTAVIDGVFRFTCLNTGAGIDPEELPFVFNRFYRSERAKKGVKTGVGIGLAIAKELVEAHGGQIGCESKAGWTMFWFEIPSERKKE